MAWHAIFRGTGLDARVWRCHDGGVCVLGEGGGGCFPAFVDIENVRFLSQQGESRRWKRVSGDPPKMVLLLLYPETTHEVRT